MWRLNGYAALLDGFCQEIEHRGTNDKNVDLIENIPGISKRTIQLMPMT
jgi:hypothetical protein